MLSERVSEMTETLPRLSPSISNSPGIPVTNVPHKPFHRPGFPTEYPSMPSPADRQSYPTSPSSPCSTTSEHDSSLEKQTPMDSDNSDDGEKDVYSKMDYYRNPNNNGEHHFSKIYSFIFSNFLLFSFSVCFSTSN